MYQALLGVYGRAGSEINCPPVQRGPRPAPARSRLSVNTVPTRYCSTLLTVVRTYYDVVANTESVLCSL